MFLSSTHLLVLSGSCSFHAYPFNRSVRSSAQVLFYLSILASLFYRSAVRICSSLFLFSNGVFSTLFISVVFLSFNLFNLSRFVVSLVCQRSNLVLLLLFLFLFPPVPSWISGRDPLVVVECCNAPRPELQLPSRVPRFLCVFYFYLLLLCLLCIMSSCHKSFASHLNKWHGSLIHLNRGSSLGDSLYNISSRY